MPAFAPWLEQVRSQPRIAMILGAAVLAAGVAGAALWGRSPEYRVLYSNVSDRDGGSIIASLQQMNVPYRFSEGGGALLVPAEQVSETRLKLASQGLPRSGGVGFELLDNQKFGTSQFAEQVNYQRGLEGELARSIESIGSVQSARVHLALPKASLFVRDQKKPSASVMLTLHRGRSVDEGQISAIVHMVSSSVPELDAKSITVVDQRGNLLSAANAGTRGLDGSQLKYVENIEQSYVRRIEGILQPIVGAGNVRAQVAADVDFSVVEHTDEKYRPNQEAGASAVRSQQSSESSQPGSAAPGGVPGALTNQPPLNPTAPLATASAPARPASAATTARAGGGSSRREVTTNYEVDRSIRHTQQAAGVTRRLSVAVVVNHREVRAANGKTSMVPLAAAELEQVRNLVREAMGFDQARGDSLNVVNSPFTVETVPQVEVPAWKDPELIALAKSGAQYLLGAAALAMLWFALVRPRRRTAAAAAPATATATALPRADDPAELASSAALQLAQTERDAALEREASRRKADIEYAQQAAADDPKLVASLVRHWMTT
ncbi:MAG TPA: flagellar basal-body MS-ring/collar protein FliF [Ramlibacter sp.]|nr:flagellar basal-body MS-ring/collar protein FliF [Ramlibacter sp.]HWI83374.1 flagellar basal-body MS-ring/collar protein FliF [Ramlibacter sp.]